MCKYCYGWYLDSELDPQNDSHSISIGNADKNINIYFNYDIDRTILNRPVIYLDILKYSELDTQNHCVGSYVPKFCPECGRELTENNKYFQKCISKV